MAQFPGRDHSPDTGHPQRRGREYCLKVDDPLRSSVSKESLSEYLVSCTEGEKAIDAFELLVVEKIKVLPGYARTHHGIVT